MHPRTTPKLTRGTARIGNAGRGQERPPNSVSGCALVRIRTRRGVGNALAHQGAGSSSIASQNHEYRLFHPITSAVFWYPFWYHRWINLRFRVATHRIRSTVLLGQLHHREGWLTLSVAAGLAVAWLIGVAPRAPSCSPRVVADTCPLWEFYSALWAVQATVTGLMVIAASLLVTLTQQGDSPVPMKVVRKEAWLFWVVFTNGAATVWPLVWLGLFGPVAIVKQPMSVPLIFVAWAFLLRSVLWMTSLTRIDFAALRTKQHAITTLAELDLRADWRRFPMWNDMFTSSIVDEVRLRAILAPLDAQWRRDGLPDLVPNSSTVNPHRARLLLADERQVLSPGGEQLLGRAHSALRGRLRFTGGTQRILGRRAFDGYTRYFSTLLARSASAEAAHQWSTVVPVVTAFIREAGELRARDKTPAEPMRISQEGHPLATLKMTPGSVAAGESVPLQRGFPQLWAVARECLPSGAFHEHARMVRQPEAAAGFFPPLLEAACCCGVPGVFFSRVLVSAAAGAIHRDDLYGLVLAMRQISRGGGSAVHQFKQNDAWPMRLREEVGRAIATAIRQLIVQMRLLQAEEIPAVGLRQRELAQVIAEMTTAGRTGHTDWIRGPLWDVLHDWADLTSGQVPSTGVGELGPWMSLPAMTADVSQSLYDDLMAVAGTTEADPAAGGMHP